MQKWEYCAITGISGGGNLLFPVTNPSNAILVKFTGEKQEWGGGVNDHDHLAQIIARLGIEGWEMVGCGNIRENIHAMYFKRPL